ncbi:hypothetical protein DENSPDRAFT_932763 [Dentipellis sp. KUC8613]|nr:hypothetical protein DENSPDRAFT_932763 [Dentipellis sp. KUC8613]
MPALHSVTLVGGWAFTFEELVTSPVFFPKLEELTVSEVSLSEMTSLLTSFPAHHSFKAISLVMQTDATGEEWEVEAFIQALCSHCNPATLTHLRLTLFDEMPWEDFDWTLDCHVLIALRQFTQLREFSIKTHRIQWTDQFLKDFAPSWGSLRILEISSGDMLRSSQPAEFNFTMESLIPLATFCPNLHIITLELYNWDAPNPALMQVIPRPSLKEQTSLPMVHVCLGHSSYAPPKNLRVERRVATVLKALFPNVRSAWNAGVEFWIRHDWPEYQDLTQEGYAIRFGPVVPLW